MESCCQHSGDRSVRGRAPKRPFSTTVMSSTTGPRHTHRRRWGQNFLRSSAAARRIVEAIGPEEGETIVEIGPGEGALTAHLAELGRALLLIEIDPLLIPRLEARFGSATTRIVHGDATEVDLPEVPFRAVGNLPYNVSNPIIRRVLRHPRCRGAVFMVQKEVADRYTARPGDPDYGFLTVTTLLYAAAEKILTLGASSFFPRPKVSSTVVRFDVRDPVLENAPERIDEVASACFRQRRKTLRNNLSIWRDLGKEAAEEAIGAAGIDPSRRAETLSLAELDRLTTALAERIDLPESKA
jgi:16S rRNA (adenine1518-N6/adenine1519-N6)-dimethyltransferase